MQGLKHVYRTELDRVVVYSVVNDSPRTFENVKGWLSNNWTPATGLFKNLISNSWWFFRTSIKFLRYILYYQCYFLIFERLLEKFQFSAWSECPRTKITQNKSVSQSTVCRPVLDVVKFSWPRKVFYLFYRMNLIQKINYSII